MGNKIKISGLFFIGIVISGALILFFLLPKIRTIEGSYIQLPIEMMFSEADYIFKGTIVEIGETRWNQDSYRIWEGGLPYHVVVVQVEESFSGELKGEVIMTVIGNNSLDKRQVMDSNDNFLVGDEMVFFARQTEFVWKGEQRRSATKTAIMLMGAPDNSILRETIDGQWQAFDGSEYQLEKLEEVISIMKEEVAERGAIPSVVPVSEE